MPSSSRPELIEAGHASPAAQILWNLPEHLQTIEVLRALVCADLAGFQRCLISGLSQVRLSSSQPS